MTPDELARFREPAWFLSTAGTWVAPLRASGECRKKK
jgi:hypothetical protein